MAGFETIYLEHFDSVFRYTYSLCRDESLAEEITQDAFYKALENLDNFDGKCRLYVWLCQIAKNTYFTYAKKQKRYVSEPESAPTSLPILSIENMILERDTAWQLHKLLHHLQEPYKEVFSLRVFGELPFAQIGELFGKSDSWARLVFYRAKKEIRRGWDESTL